MKKWSISLVVLAGLAIVAFVAPGAASAAPSPYCPTGQHGTPPYCQPDGGNGGNGGGDKPNPPAGQCQPGQVGTAPNCVTPTVAVGAIKLLPNSTKLTLKVNAPGTVKISGAGIKSKTVKVSPGNVKLNVQLTPKQKKKLKQKGKLSLKVKVTYAPTGGSPVVKTVTIKVKAPKGKKG